MATSFWTLPLRRDEDGFIMDADDRKIADCDIDDDDIDDREARKDAIVRAVNANTTLIGALQWLLDDMSDAGETHSEAGTIFDSVEHAAAALVEAAGILSWYTPDMAASYRRHCAAQDEAEAKARAEGKAPPDPKPHIFQKEV